MSLRIILDSHERASIVTDLHAVPGREATGEKVQRIVAFQGGLRTLPPGVCRFRERCCMSATLRRYLPDEIARRQFPSPLAPTDKRQPDTRGAHARPERTRRAIGSWRTMARVVRHEPTLAHSEARRSSLTAGSL
jgi:hypothetical protein